MEAANGASSNAMNSVAMNHIAANSSHASIRSASRLSQNRDRLRILSSRDASMESNSAMDAAGDGAAGATATSNASRKAAGAANRCTVQKASGRHPSRASLPWRRSQQPD